MVIHYAGNFKQMKPMPNNLKFNIELKTYNGYRWANKLLMLGETETSLLKMLETDRYFDLNINSDTAFDRGANHAIEDFKLIHGEEIN